MSDKEYSSPEGNRREGRVSRTPLIVVVAVLVAVAAGGALLSQNRDSKQLLSAEQQASSTTVTLSPTSAAPVGEDASTTTVAETTESAPSTTALPPGGQVCTAASLLASVKASGQVDPSIANSASVSDFECADPYARAGLQAANADDVSAYFVRSNGVWRMLVIGSAPDPVGAGVPSAVADQLRK